MAASGSGSGSSFVKTKRTKGFVALLTTAACEWFLIFLMLVDALLSFLLTKFASYCQLQLPCLLCSRLDHILGYEKTELYQNLFCSNHKSEISSLISCHIHGKVADGHRMCDDCLLSFTTSTNHNTKTRRLLMGKLGLVLGGSGYRSPSLSREMFSGSKISRPCICCGKLWKSEHNTPRSIQQKSPGREFIKPCIPVPHVPRQNRLNHRDNSRKENYKFYGPEGNRSFHPLSHVGYTELRFTSDSESEFLFSDDDDDIGCVFHENIKAGNDPIAQFTPLVSPKCIRGDWKQAKPHVEPNISKHHDAKFLGSDAVNDNSLEEINWQKENKKSLSSDLLELMSLDEVSPSSVAVNITSEESEGSKITSCLSQNSLPAPLFELMIPDGTHTLIGESSNKTVDATQASGTRLVSETHDNVLENIGTREQASTETDPMISDSAPASLRQENSSNTSKSPDTSKEREVPGFVTEQPTIEEVDKKMEEMELSPSDNSLPAPQSEHMISDGTDTLVEESSNKTVDVTQASDTELVSEKHENVSENIGIREQASTETDQMISDSAPTSPREENSSNTSKSPVTSKEREVPGFVTEQPTIEEVDKVTEELELSPSHNSSPHGSNMSSAVTINHARSPMIDDEASSSNATQDLQKSASVESGLESLDESNFTEIEGESIVDQLKRRIEYDKKCMDALHKELEEERNASAIAANEAMSMITRLQEEKAALQMEALQYLRMMEEQAEYDTDELDKVNDLLTEKEKEIQDLEAELEFYKLNWPDEPMVHSMPKESCDSKGDNVTVQNVGVHNVTNPVNMISDSKFPEVSNASNEAVPGGTSSLEFEEEKQYISQCLSSLEKRLHQISFNGISSDMSNVRPEKLEVSESNQQGPSNGEGPQVDGNEGTDLSIQKNFNTSNENHTDNEGSSASYSDDCSLSKENINSTTSVVPKNSTPGRGVDLVALENEISDLNDRLEALEFDRDLLDHIINSLRNGDGGKQFIEDIAHQLHELRKIEIRSRW